jgi:hypothetical protein
MCCLVREKRRQRQVQAACDTSKCHDTSPTLEQTQKDSPCTTGDHGVGELKTSSTEEDKKEEGIQASKDAG